MGITTVNQEMTIALPPATIFNGFVIDARVLLPKALPHVIKSMEVVEGEWGAPGSITKTTLNEGFVKYKIDLVDKEKLVFKHTLIEGDVIGERIEYVSYESRFEHSGSGCIAKLTMEYHTKGDLELTEEEISAGKHKADLQFKSVSDYIAANPNYA